MTMHYLWPTPIKLVNIFTEVDRDFNYKLMQEHKELAAQSWLLRGYWKGWPDTPVRSILKEFTERHVNEYADELKFNMKFKVGDAWINSTNKDRPPTHPHHHSGSRIVAVYYVQAPGGSGDLLFQDPRGPIKFSPTPKKDGQVSFHFSPKAGDLAIFPGYIIHNVVHTNVEEMRITVATNFEEVDHHK